MGPKPSPDRLSVWIVGDSETVLEVSRGFTEAARERIQLSVQIACIHPNDSVPDGSPSAVIAVPTTRTWSRLRHGSKNGPLPLRSAEWPWGFPTLVGAPRTEMDEANRCLRHCLSVLGVAQKRHSATELIFFHLEDFGQAQTGTPATVCQLQLERSFAREFYLHRSAVYQCMFGEAASPSPIALLTSVSHPVRHAKRGWPKFRAQPRTVYTSPLPRRCGCGRERSATTQRSSSLKRATLTQPFAKELASKVLKRYLDVGLSSRGETSDCRHSDTGSNSTWEVDTLSSGEEDPTALRLNSVAFPKHGVMSSLTSDAPLLLNSVAPPKHSVMSSLTADAPLSNAVDSSMPKHRDGSSSRHSARKLEAGRRRPVLKFMDGISVLTSSDTDNIMSNSNHGVDDSSTGIYVSCGQKDSVTERAAKEHIDTHTEREIDSDESHTDVQDSECVKQETPFENSGESTRPEILI